MSKIRWVIWIGEKENQVRDLGGMVIGIYIIVRTVIVSIGASWIGARRLSINFAERVGCVRRLYQEVDEWSTKTKKKLVRAAEKFIQKHLGHEIEASSSELHYFNLWCVTCEKDENG